MAALQSRISFMLALYDDFDVFQTELEVLSENVDDMFVERERIESRYFALVARAKFTLKQGRASSPALVPALPVEDVPQHGSDCGHGLFQLPEMDLSCIPSETSTGILASRGVKADSISSSTLWRTRMAALESRISFMLALYDDFDVFQTELEVLSENVDDMFVERERIESRYFALVARAKFTLKQGRASSPALVPALPVEDVPQHGSDCGHGLFQLPEMDLSCIPSETSTGILASRGVKADSISSSTLWRSAGAVLLELVPVFLAAFSQLSGLSRVRGLLKFHTFSLYPSDLSHLFLDTSISDGHSCVPFTGRSLTHLFCGCHQ
uniref:Uncharacterized protein n=1 Tax=Heliothis virescens TaxID=7102 RepID=A0A2A4K9J4_HELVI